LSKRKRKEKKRNIKSRKINKRKRKLLVSKHTMTVGFLFPDGDRILDPIWKPLVIAVAQNIIFST